MPDAQGRNTPVAPDGEAPVGIPGDAWDRVVLRPGDPLHDLVNAPLSPGALDRIERLERSSARAAARAGRVLLD